MRVSWLPSLPYKIRREASCRGGACHGRRAAAPDTRGLKMQTRMIGAGLLLAVVMATGGAATASAEDMLRVGAPVPLTGPLSPEGVKQQQGYDLWADAANRAGGIKLGARRLKVEIVYADYQSNTPRAIQTAERLITEDKVDFLFAPFGSGAAKAGSSVAEKYEIP